MNTRGQYAVTISMPWGVGAASPVLCKILLSEQLQQLIKGAATPHNDPIHHVIFSAGYKDRVGI